ncbi:MAG: phytoene/squalene synthase family protein [Brachybacterium sp.]|uniref:phytoene/squalene synthase family protein n=1 Tax=Brachybacterium sp. TaxID=1891286 RepID=UPI0026521FDA|nr:squalene/phytoene synthase family protein [Brachybacterium sp.]
MSGRSAGEIPTARYDRVAQRSAGCVIAGYSTSFGWATRLLEEPVRTHVRSIYALVRIADETVDDPDPTFSAAERSRLLEGLAAETARAVAGARSTNLVVQAFALTARRSGIGPALIDPFFASMRADLSVAEHDEASLAEYVHGSAEVVGLMCLRVFLDGDDAACARLAPAASALGAAFQKVNFLRDLAEDHDELGRTYFPGLGVDDFGDAERDRLLDDIDADLALAGTAIPHLPVSSRRAVAAAHGFYGALSRRLRTTPAQQIRRARVRVPDHEKAVIMARAVLRARR